MWRRYPLPRIPRASTAQAQVSGDSRPRADHGADRFWDAEQHETPLSEAYRRKVARERDVSLEEFSRFLLRCDPARELRFYPHNAKQFERLRVKPSRRRRSPRS